MSEKEIREAIAAQEEHIKRVTSCGGQLYTSHRWVAGEGAWQECARCGVTKTPQDYDAKIAAYFDEHDGHQALLDEQRAAAGDQDEPDPSWDDPAEHEHDE